VGEPLTLEQIQITLYSKLNARVDLLTDIQKALADQILLPTIAAKSHLVIMGCIVSFSEL
jgi:hypothetical protein